MLPFVRGALGHGFLSFPVPCRPKKGGRARLVPRGRRPSVEREQHRIKRDIDKRWAELVYDAQWFSPAVKSLNAFINDTQQYVNGEIRMVLR